MADEAYDTLSHAVDDLTQRGFEKDFKAEDNQIIDSFSGKKFSVEDLLIVRYYRFEGMTDPEDESIVFAIEAKDGTKGTLVMSYSSEHSQNVELIRKLIIKNR